MKLKEKLEQYIDPQIDVIHLEQIADEFAIEFAYWCEWRLDRAIKTYKELLEIYKKEKGL